LRNTSSGRVFTWYHHGSQMKTDSAVFHTYSSFSRGARHSRECTQRTFLQIANNSRSNARVPDIAKSPSRLSLRGHTRQLPHILCGSSFSTASCGSYPDASTSTGFSFPIPQYSARSCSKRWPEVRG
jgi:hypothetical protein